MEQRINQERSPKDQKIMELNEKLDPLDMAVKCGKTLRQEDIDLRDKLHHELDTLPADGWGDRENELVEKVKTKLFNEYMQNVFWKTYTPVEFKWVVYPDGEKFELVSFSNDSWRELNSRIDTVLDIIYSK